MAHVARPSENGDGWCVYDDELEIEIEIWDTKAAADKAAASYNASENNF